MGISLRRPPRERQIGALIETRKAHESLLELQNTEREETDPILRLRKVYCHVIAITAWSVDSWAIHAMAPDIRAALVQLRSLVLNDVCTEVHEAGETCEVPRCFSAWDGMLAPFSHPTATVLVFFNSIAGFREADVRCLRDLCLLLNGLLGCYAIALGLEALRAGRPVKEGLPGVAERVSPLIVWLNRISNRRLATSTVAPWY